MKITPKHFGSKKLFRKAVQELKQEKKERLSMFVAGLQIELVEFEAPAMQMNPNAQPNRVGGDIKQINVQGQSRRRVIEEVGERFALWIADLLLLEQEHARAELEETANIQGMKIVREPS